MKDEIETLDEALRFIELAEDELSDAQNELIEVYEMADCGPRRALYESLIHRCSTAGDLLADMGRQMRREIDAD